MDTSTTLLSDGVITLRAATLADAAAMAAVVRSSVAELAPYMPWATEVYDEAAARAWIERMGPNDLQCLIVGDDGELAGACGLDQVNEINRSANLGYWLRSDRTGRGWATRATRLLARHGLTRLGLERIEILMAVENEASRRVAERAGATFEGTLRRRLLLHGRFHDAHLYSLVREDLG